MSDKPAEPGQSDNLRPWQFKKGQSGNPSGKAKPESDNIPPLLAAMRYVGRTKTGGADKGLQVHCRKLLVDDPAGFIKQLNALETAWLKSKEPTAKDRKREEKESAPTADADLDLKDLLASLIGGFTNAMGGKDKG